MKKCQGKRPKVVVSHQSVMVAYDISNVDQADPGKAFAGD